MQKLLDRGVGLTVLDAAPAYTAYEELRATPSALEFDYLAYSGTQNAGYDKMNNVYVRSYANNDVRTGARYSMTRPSSQEGFSYSNSTLEWFVDPCWAFDYQNLENGQGRLGVLNDLVRKVELGHRVRVVFDNASYIPEVVRIRNGHVCAKIETAVIQNATEVSPGEEIAQIRFIDVCTTGNVKELIVTVGNGTEIARRSYSAKVDWYTDVRTWTMMIEYDVSNDMNVTQTRHSPRLSANNSAADYVEMEMYYRRYAIDIDDYTVYGDQTYASSSTVFWAMFPDDEKSAGSSSEFDWTNPAYTYQWMYLQLNTRPQKIKYQDYTPYSHSFTPSRAMTLGKLRLFGGEPVSVTADVN